ncbi:hypothetical protein MRX96_003979 [Rhipicephalus microplus]
MAVRKKPQINPGVFGILSIRTASRRGGGRALNDEVGERGIFEYRRSATHGAVTDLTGGASKAANGARNYHTPDDGAPPRGRPLQSSRRRRRVRPLSGAGRFAPRPPMQAAAELTFFSHPWTKRQRRCAASACR